MASELNIVAREPGAGGGGPPKTLERISDPSRGRIGGGGPWTDGNAEGRRSSGVDPLRSSAFDQVLRASRLRRLAPDLKEVEPPARLVRNEEPGRTPGGPLAAGARHDRRQAGERPEATQMKETGETDTRIDEEEEGDKAEMAATFTAAALTPTPIPGSRGEVAAAETGVTSSPVIENPWVSRLLEDSGEGRATAARTSAGEGEGLSPELIENLGGMTGAQADPGSQDTSFDLLDFQEMMDPDLQIDSASEDMFERLQQALADGRDNALLDEMGEVVLPQVLRGMVALARGNGVSEMRLQLKPADLGEIELRVRAVEGIVRGEIMVQTPELKSLLESQLGKLRVALAQQGLHLEGFDVGVAGQDRFGDPAGGLGSQDLPGRPVPQERPTDRGDEAVPGPVIVPSGRGDHEVDYLV